MTAPRRSPGSRLQAFTLALSIALAAVLGAIVYLAVTSLPYLATSPATDPVFGALNSCLLSAVPERVGFAVSRDNARASAFSHSRLVECAGTPPVATTWERAGLTHAAYDDEGALWVSTSSDDAGEAALLRLEGGTLVERGPLRATAVVGVRGGVVALAADGSLVSIAGDGSVRARRELPSARNVNLAANADGALVALWGGGKLTVVNAGTLESTPAEVACSVSRVWWRPEAPLFLADCLDISVEVHALTSHSALVDARRRVPSTLTGPGGVYVQACDGLPCSVEAPR
ncbi:MAG: hypothetical protein DI536_32330 [Archangium gephyra]|uniref:Uncharacterized protein n=1 Tax=Archangium gephyra TaxID=48 RepID=A0A2W5SX66_9BACT|nr:MAG: hypothetical protein DI536_32330 [Archangium gephyra]